MSIRRILSVAIAALTLCAVAPPIEAQYATITGTLSASNGLPASNYLLTFTPSQFGYISGTGVVVNTTTSCATSVDGSVVGLRNPLVKPPVTVGFTGTLAPANYYVKYAFYDASGNLTLVSPETVIQLTSTGRLIVASPTSGLPAGAVGMNVYISASTNTETLQGQTTGSAAFIQSVPLITGTAVPSTNTTVCKQIANDAIWPSGTGYTVALVDISGNTLPGYPMQWQIMGPGTTINLSTGLPYYHGTVYFPTPILASPLNHAQQSISGPLSLAGYNLTDVGAIGLGTSLPAWPIDVENGAVNASGGFIVNGGTGVTTGNCLAAGSDMFHTFNRSVACITSVSSFYQTVASAGTAQTQRAALNFGSEFALTDASSPSRTTVDLGASGVTAGTYTNPTVTFDAFGRATAATSGTAAVGTPVDVTGTRSLGTIYHNTGTLALLVSGAGRIGGGSGDSTISCLTGATSGLGQTPWKNTTTGTISGEAVGFNCQVVPAGWYYEVTGTNLISSTPLSWIETPFN